jgi:hypothetical protein
MIRQAFPAGAMAMWQTRDRTGEHMELFTPPFPGIIFGILLLLIALLFFLLFFMNRKYKRFMKGLGSCDVESLMHRYAEDLMQLRIHLETRTEPRITAMEKKMPTVLRNVGMVSYNAFENMGNLMSFSIAALDDGKNGFVLSGIYGRDSSYVYAKDVKAGVPGKELSGEEKTALRIAMEGSRS